MVQEVHILSAKHMPDSAIQMRAMLAYSAMLHTHGFNNEVSKQSMLGAVSSHGILHILPDYFPSPVCLLLRTAALEPLHANHCQLVSSQPSNISLVAWSQLQLCACRPLMQMAFSSELWRTSFCRRFRTRSEPRAKPPPRSMHLCTAYTHCA